MILVDTSVWIDHFRREDLHLIGILERSDVMMHPWVIGELALGSMRNREETLRLLAALPKAPVASDGGVLQFVSDEKLHGSGIGLVDAQLLASTRSVPGTLLWTRDRRLAEMRPNLTFPMTVILPIRMADSWPALRRRTSCVPTPRRGGAAATTSRPGRPQDRAPASSAPGCR